MNELIKRFALDALKNKHAPFAEKAVGDVHCFDDEELQAFAEFMVRECIDICERQRLKILNNPDDPSWTEHLAECQTTMEQTFLRN